MSSAFSSNLGVAERAALTERSSFLEGLKALFAPVASESLCAALGLPRRDADRRLVEVAPPITGAPLATIPCTQALRRMLDGIERSSSQS